MKWQEKLKSDFMGEQPVKSVQDQAVVEEPQFVEVPPNYLVNEDSNGGYSIVPVNKEPNVLVKAITLVEKRTLSATGGAVLNRVANGFGLLPDDDRLLEEYKKAPKSGIKSWLFAMNPRRIISSKILGGEVGAEKKQKMQRNRIASAIEEVMSDSAKKRKDPSVLMSVAMSVLGDNLDQIFEVAHSGQFRGGPRMPEERELASVLVSEKEVLADPSVLVPLAERKIENTKEEVLLSVGNRALLREERQRLEGIIKNPTVTVPGCSDGVTLVEQTVFEQGLAALFGAKGFNWGSLAGGQRLFIAQNGSVVLRTGVENEVIANDIGELVPSTDISAPFENLLAVSEKRLNLGKLSEKIKNIATRKGKDLINSPGLLSIQRSGADEQDGMIVTNVKKVFNGLQRLSIMSERATDRIDQIDQSVKHLRVDDDTFNSIELGQTVQQMSGLPRLREVTKEAREIIGRREVSDLETLRNAGLVGVDDVLLQRFVKMSESQQQIIMDNITRKSGSEDTAARAMAVLRRKSRKFIK